MKGNMQPTLAFIVIVALTLIPLILYLLALQNALKKCAPSSRTMAPGKVWLTLVPVLGMVWQFIVVLDVAKSLENEFERFGIPCPEATPGQTIGLAMCVCNCCTVIPLLGRLAGLASLALWIAHWIKIASYSRLLETCHGNAVVSRIA
jgi:hypothetical protein